ncbi:MAG: putative intracellular protease/amidase [Planctomycetota bacterium]|jgi:putative intracellular protease/amidase
MAEEEKQTDENLDSDGLVIQRYEHTVLVVVPPEEYREETLRYARSSLLGVHVGTRSISTQSEEAIFGVLQDEFLVDGPVTGVSMDDYAGIVLVDGGPGSSIYSDPDVIRLVSEAGSQGKLIAAWGDSVCVLASAGVVKGRKVTGAGSCKAALVSAGGKYNGVECQRDGHLVTARDESAGFRLGKAMVQVIALP